MRRWIIILVFALAFVVTPLTSRAIEPSDNPRDDVRTLDQHVAAAITALNAGDIKQAQAEYTAYDQGWKAIEDGVRDQSRESYRAIEGAMGDVRYALKQSPVDTSKALTALQALAAADQTFIEGSAAQTISAAPANRTLAGELPRLDQALAAISAGNIAAAQTEVEAFRTAWPDVEGVVAAKDGAAYARSEDLQAQASAELAAGNTAAASATLSALQATLQPFATATLRYGIVDAMSILLREGLEALLIIAALLAFLQRSGNNDKRRWIWIGGAAGIVASLLAAIVIQQLFSAVVTGANRELIEGITGLVAAVLLIYVSYWLHSKTHISGWQRYLSQKTNAALATGSLFSLASLAFLSVFREGAETALFYIGIAPSIALRDLLIGLAIAAVILAIVGVLVLGLGRRIPLKPFFQVTSVLIWYLGFKFIGSGIRALQVARVVPETRNGWLPSIDVLGLYPTWETTLPQLVLLAVAIGVVLWTRSVVKSAPQQRTVSA